MNMFSPEITGDKIAGATNLFGCRQLRAVRTLLEHTEPKPVAFCCTRPVPVLKRAFDITPGASIRDTLEVSRPTLEMLIWIFASSVSVSETEI
jgi:hypothetical protein